MKTGSVAGTRAARATRTLRWLACGLVTAGACIVFDELPGGVCGNGVIDPGEDCDTFGRDVVRCAAPGEAAQCRLVCDDGVTCPEGWGCGSDHVCREPSGAFGGPAHVLDETVGLILVEDFDGDGRKDLLTSGADVVIGTGMGLELASVTPNGEVRAHFFSPSGTLEQSVPVVTDPNAHPSVGDLSNDGLADVVVNTGTDVLGVATGLGVYRGSADRSFAPAAYASQPIDAAAASVWICEVIATAAGQEPMALLQHDVTGPSQVAHLQAGGPGSLLTTAIVTDLPPVAELAGDVAFGQIDADLASSPCDEIALAFVNDDFVTVAATCTGWFAEGNNSLPVNEVNTPAYIVPTTVYLQNGTHPTGVHLFDVDGDGHLDLLIGSELGMQVAYGLGDMTFVSDAGVNNAAVYDIAWAVIERPLAVGHLNDDGIVDVVVPSAIYLSRLFPSQTGSGMGAGGAGGMGSGAGGGGGAGGAGSPQLDYILEAAVMFSQPPMGHALVGDFNANGITDVMVASSDVAGLEFYSGAGDGLFNQFSISTEGIVRDMAAGDFDGDVMTDIAIAEEAPSADVGDLLSVCFGRAGPAPQEPASIGRLDTIEGIATGRLPIAPFNPTVDGMFEIAAVSSSDASSLSMAILYGSADRKLQSPFALVTRQVEGPSLVHLPVRTTVAELGVEQGHGDIAVIAQDFIKSKLGFWLVASTGDAALSETTSWPSEPIDPPNVLADLGIIAAINVDDDADDEIVLAAPALDSATLSLAGGVLLVADPQDMNAGRALVEVARYETEEVFVGQPTAECPECPPAETGSVATVALAGEQRIATDDLDGDGRRDVAVLGYVPSGDGVSFKARLVIYWNQATGDASSAFDPSQRSVVEPDGGAITGFTTLSADADGARELVVLTKQGAFLLDFAGKSVPERVPLVGVPRGIAIAAADLTGDGLEDLVVGTDKEVELLPQLAVNP